MRKGLLLFGVVTLLLVLSNCSPKIPEYEAPPVSQEKRERIQAADSFFDLLKLTETIELDLDYGLWPVTDFVVGEKYIIGIIATSNSRAYAWHRASGRFLGEMTPYGKGPGEAINVMSAVFIDDSTALLFDIGLSRASLFRLSPEGFSFDDVIDMKAWSTGAIDYAWKKDGRIYLFARSGGVGTHRVIILDHLLTPIKQCFPRKHNSFAMFEVFVISGDKIFMSGELYHKSMKQIKRDSWKVEGGGKILVSDCDGNLIGRIDLPFEDLILNMIPDRENETFFMDVFEQGKIIVDGNGRILKKLDNRLDTDRFPWLETSLRTTIPRGELIYVDRGQDGKLILRVFEYSGGKE